MSAAMKPRIFFTFLQPEHFSLLDEPLRKWSEELGKEIPTLNPTTASVVVAIDESTNKIVGFFALQTVVHAEPLWVEESERGNTELLEGLIEKVQEPFIGTSSGFYTFIPDARIERLAVKHGMKVLDWKVAVKEFPVGE